MKASARYLLHCILLSILLGLAVSVSAQQPQRGIIEITDDLYQAQNNNHYTVFLLTNNGIVLGDPLNVEFANWLKQELATRFGVPVRYVVYSHWHGDHASGGDVFADTAEIIAHERMPVNLAREIHAEGRRSGLALRNVRPPDTTYTDHRVISLGGKAVELIHPGRNHTDDMTIMYFPAQRVVYAVDFIYVRRLPYQDMCCASPTEWIDSVESVQSLDYDVIAPAHSFVGTKSDVSDYLGYLEDLVSAVSEGITAGRTLEELKQSITLEAYRDWGEYGSYRALNIEGVYNSLAIH